MKPITENIIEQSAIETLQGLGWAYVNGREVHRLFNKIIFIKSQNPYTHSTTGYFAAQVDERGGAGEY